MAGEEENKNAEGEQKSADDEQEEESPIEQANKAAERLEKANAEQKILLARQEKILADAKLQGRSVTGQQAIKKTKEDEIKEGAIKMFEGSGIDEAIKKYG